MEKVRQALNALNQARRRAERNGDKHTATLIDTAIRLIVEDINERSTSK